MHVLTSGDRGVISKDMALSALQLCMSLIVVCLKVQYEVHVSFGGVVCQNKTNYAHMGHFGMG